MTDTLAFEDLPPQVQADLRADLSHLPPEWRILRILPGPPGSGPVVELTDDSGEVIAQIAILVNPS